MQVCNKLAAKSTIKKQPSVPGYQLWSPAVPTCRRLAVVVKNERRFGEQEKCGTGLILRGWTVREARFEGTLITANAHKITAVIGSEVLSLAWATAQLGWVGGPFVLSAFSLITYFTSTMHPDCYQPPEPHLHGYCDISLR
ncbi:hypothetical protein LguiB_017422 [Lonicera macranthoides]